MVQEDLALNSRLASFERRIKDLERLITLGLVGSDVEVTLRQHTVLLGKLIGDSTLGDILYGPFPGADSSMTIKRTNSRLYRGGGLNIVSTLAGAALSVDLLNALPFYMPGQPNLVKQLTVNVTTAAGGTTNAKLGIYSNKHNDVYPDRKLFEGSLSWTTTGNKSVVGIRESLPRGLFWLTLLLDQTGNSFDAYNASDGAWAPIGESIPVPTGGGAIGWQAAFTFGTLPDVYPSTAAALTLAACVWLGFTT